MCQVIEKKLFEKALIKDYSCYRCPVTGQTLLLRGEELITPDGKNSYRLIDGIPDFAAISVKGNLKERVQSFWNNCPNESSVSDKAIGTPAFYRETEEERYDHHKDIDKPFLKQAVGFERISGKRVLEVGCGIGMDAIQFARNDNDLYLLDLSLQSIRITLGRFQNEGFQARACVGDAERLPFETNSFDVVYSYGVLHHSPDTQRSVEQILRVLKPGGLAIVMLYSKWSAYTIFRLAFHEGLRGGNLLRLGSWNKLLSEWTELQSRTKNSVNPLTQTFSKKECQKLFQKFSSYEIEKHYLNNYQLAEGRYLLRLLPRFARNHLPKMLGWNTIIHATK